MTSGRGRGENEDVRMVVDDSNSNSNSNKRSLATKRKVSVASLDFAFAPWLRRITRCANSHLRSDVANGVEGVT